jgi:hypothetical protein
VFIEVRKPMPTIDGAADQVVLLNMDTGLFFYRGQAGYCGFFVNGEKYLIHEDFDKIRECLESIGQLSFIV